MTAQSPAERFWSKVEVRAPDECWPWKGCRTNTGYGVFSVRKKASTAHRFAYGFTYGTTDAEHICHTCDNPWCCNPAHLWPGTVLENIRDKIAKGRSAYVGLTVEQARRAKFGNEKGTDLAREFKVSGAIISRIRSGHVWKWLKPETDFACGPLSHANGAQVGTQACAPTLTFGARQLLPHTRRAPPPTARIT